MEISKRQRQKKNILKYILDNGNSVSAQKVKSHLFFQGLSITLAREYLLAMVRLGELSIDNVNKQDPDSAIVQVTAEGKSLCQ